MENSGKAYKVTYKTYFNERLKKSFFHTTLMHPLYVQLIFDRTPLYFKSYYYDLFSKSKYAIRVAGRVFTPDIKEIITKEEKLAEFIIDKNLPSFSLDLFKKEYAFYSRDLLDIMEASFMDYLFIFLQDEGMAFFAETIRNGAADCKLYDLALDMKKALHPSLYKKFIENSFYLAPPYLPLYAFTEKPKRTPFRMLSVMEWEQPATKEKFAAFFALHYPDNNLTEALEKIQEWVNK